VHRPQAPLHRHIHQQPRESPRPVAPPSHMMGVALGGRVEEEPDRGWEAEAARVGWGSSR
jgi:hypothetical protein